MRIDNIRKRVGGGRARIAADVIWEDCDQPRREVFIETSAAFADDLSPNPHAFLAGCVVPAMHFGERRIHLDEPVCPSAREGLARVMSLVHSWAVEGYRPVRIEAPTLGSPRFGRRPRYAGLFMSGGIDALASLRVNRRLYPPGHPGYVKDCLVIHGFDIGAVVERGMKYPVFDRALGAMGRVAADAGVGLIPVYTNLRHLCDGRELWLEKFCGAVLGAVAQAFASRLDPVAIASSYPVGHLVPCGTHPLIDPGYSTHDLRIRHRELHLSRMEKTRIVSEWPVGLDNLRVCLANVADRLNCGRCEKCLRTMTGLAAFGALARSGAFEQDDVPLEVLETFDINIRHRAVFYEEMLPYLRAAGRDDVVRTIARMLHRQG